MCFATAANAIVEWGVIKEGAVAVRLLLLLPLPPDNNEEAAASVVAVSTEEVARTLLVLLLEFFFEPGVRFSSDEDVSEEAADRLPLRSADAAVRAEVVRLLLLCTVENDKLLVVDAAAEADVSEFKSSFGYRTAVGFTG